MSSKAVHVGIIASVLPHLFCCVLPIVLSVVGLFAPEFAHAHIMPDWLEPWLFVFSAGMLGLSWVMVVRECRCECDHCHGNHSHHASKIILAIITILFIASVLLHVIAHHS